MPNSLRCCKICEAINAPDAEFCHYCGYSCTFVLNPDEDPYELYLRVNNIKVQKQAGFLRSKNTRTENVLVKRHAVFDKIQSLKEKLANINMLLANIVSSEYREKVGLAITKMQVLLESLVKVRIELEFRKTAGNLATIREISGRETVGEVNDYLASEEEKVSEWKAELSKLFKQDAILKVLEEKVVLFRKLKENLALSLISRILSTTSVISSESEDPFLSDVAQVEMEAERIDFELDRIESEFSLS